MAESKPAKLTAKQQAFVNYYLETWNSTEAARRAGYRGNAATLAAVGYENLRKPHISAKIEERLAELTMGANEVLYRLTQQAQADFGLFLRRGDYGWEIDLEKIKLHGHLVREISIGKNGMRLKLHDAQAALVHLGRHRGVLVNRTEITGQDGGPIELVDVEEIRRKRWEQVAPILAATSKNGNGHLSTELESEDV